MAEPETPNDDKNPVITKLQANDPLSSINSGIHPDGLRAALPPGTPLAPAQLIAEHGSQIGGQDEGSPDMSPPPKVPGGETGGISRNDAAYIAKPVHPHHKRVNKHRIPPGGHKGMHNAEQTVRAHGKAEAQADTRHLPKGVHIHGIPAAAHQDVRKPKTTHNFGPNLVV